MKVLPFLFVFLLSYTFTNAQSKTFFTVKSGSQVTDLLSTEDIFYYPQFKNGQVYLKDGTKAEVKLNYSSLFDEMLFIDPRGDTLSLANEKTIKFISIDKDTFYYGQGFMRLLAGNNLGRLFTKQVWIAGNNRVIGAFNMPNTTSSTTSYTSYAAGGSRYALVLNEDVDLKKTNYFYFGDHYSRFVMANKKNLLMLFPKKQEQIELYLKENKIDFSNRDELEKFVQYLGKL